MNQELERFEPAEAGGRIAYEHVHRYALCRDRVAGKRILDVACGAGYGTNILAEVAAEATGMDIDAGATRRASAKYKRPNLKYVTGDCYSMPFEAGSFDAVVANEMIEHIDDHETFLTEVKRVLKPGGLLLVSTPNKPIYNRYKSPNPFHLSEMTVPEFRRLLKRHFGHVQLTGLRMALVPAGFDMEGEGRPSNLATAKTYRGSNLGHDRPEVANDELHLEEPEYVLASCSDQAMDDLGEPSTIFFSNDDDLWLEHEKIMSWASQLHQEDETLRADLRETSAKLGETEALLGEERQSNIRATDEARQHLHVSARLLGRLTGGEVDASPISLVESLFIVNEKLILQRARLEAIEPIAARAGQLEQDLNNLRSRHEALSNELDASRAAERATSEAFERFQRQTRQRDQERDNAAREAAEATKRLQTQLKQVQTKLAELERERGASDDQGNGSEQGGGKGSSTLARRQSRLLASHCDIQGQLGRATEAIKGSIPPAATGRKGLLEKLIRRDRSKRNIPFDRKWIEAQAPEAGRLSVSKFLSDARYHRIDPHPLFSSSYYLARSPDVAEAGLSPYAHYLEHGWREGRSPHPYFANDWYLLQNEDVVRAGTNPLIHYLEHGWKEGRRPNPVFDPTEYLDKHPDVRESGLEPLTHFVVYGLQEERDVPFDGLERDWRTLVSNGDARSLIDHLLSDRIDFAAGNKPAAPRGGGGWPPPALNNIWIPQRLRDFMVERRWEGLIPLYTYYYSVMDAYADASDNFGASPEASELIRRSRELSEELASKAQGTLAASVIIPVYNNLLDTMLCVASLLETKPKLPFEIIVADDGSTDQTAELIGGIGGIVRHVRQPKNLGFLGNCNAAAKDARGENLVLLNNDTLVFPGWLEKIIKPFQKLPDVGFVGSKLISWDGRLQEAGGIFWKDGSAWNFGRGQNAADPEFNYLKDIDYSSGASIAVPTALWHKLGGFDADYSPAYCEDSDLAFRIREAGLRTIYSPHSEVIHHEGRSHGTDTSTGIKAYQVENQRRLFERWHGVLERDNFPNGEQVLLARDRSVNKRQILVVDHYVPQFDRDAGSRTMFQFLETLTQDGWAVTFWPENLNRDPDYTRAIQDLGVEVIYGPQYLDKFADFLRSRTGLYDAVLLSRPHVAVHFIDDVRTLTDARVIYYGHDVHFARLEAQRDVDGSVDDEQVESMRALELGVCNRCDVVLYPSEEEAALIAKLVAPNVQVRAVTAYSFPDEHIQQAERSAEDILPLVGERAKLLFVGGFAHGPNVDGIVWFCREVAPILRSKGFDFDLQIAGSNPTPEVWDLDSDEAHVLGFVTDEKLDMLYRQATIVIAPLRFGAGVKGKVVEAMARGVPVATTTVGAQGLTGAEDYLFLGDTAQEFAAAVQSAADADSAKSKAGRAVDYIRKFFSRAAMADVFRQILPARNSLNRAA